MGTKKKQISIKITVTRAEIKPKLSSLFEKTLSRQDAKPKSATKRKSLGKMALKKRARELRPKGFENSGRDHNSLKQDHTNNDPR